MSHKPAAERGMEMLSEMDRMIDTFGADRAGWPAGQRERYDRLALGVKRLEVEADAEAATASRAEEMREKIAGAGRENGFGAPHEFPAMRQDPWRGLDQHAVRNETPSGFQARAHDVLAMLPGLSDAARGMLAEAIDRPGLDGGAAAAMVVARSNPAYSSGFEKVLRNPDRAHLTFDPAESAAFAAVESIRATMTTATGTGGYTIPLALDGGLAALTNSGTANPFREACTVKTTISSPARELTTAGINFSWVAEGSAFSDNTNTWTKVDVPLFKLGGFVAATFEVLEDGGATIRSTLPTLLRDARDRAEGAALATGDGVTAPKGIVTAIAAASGFVTATTRGSFTTASYDDVFRLWEALPARARSSEKVGFLGNVTIYDVIRKMGSAAPGALYTTDLTARAIPRLLGAPAYEASDMTASTTSGSYMLVAGDLSAYTVVDHVEGGMLEWCPILFDQSTARPNGTRGWVYHQRTGADLLATNLALILKS